jgi:hypothetical protein
MLSVSAVGAASTLSKQLAQIVRETGADEIIATSHIFNHQDRLHSFEIAAPVLQSLR